MQLGPFAFGVGSSIPSHRSEGETLCTG